MPKDKGSKGPEKGNNNPHKSKERRLTDVVGKLENTARPQNKKLSSKISSIFSKLSEKFPSKIISTPTITSKKSAKSSAFKRLARSFSKIRVPKLNIKIKSVPVDLQKGMEAAKKRIIEAGKAGIISGGLVIKKAMIRAATKKGWTGKTAKSIDLSTSTDGLNVEIKTNTGYAANRETGGNRYMSIDEMENLLDWIIEKKLKTDIDIPVSKDLLLNPKKYIRKYLKNKETGKAKVLRDYLNVKKFIEEKEGQRSKPVFSSLLDSHRGIGLVIDVFAAFLEKFRSFFSK